VASPEAFLARILEGVPLPVWVLDEAGKVVFANPAAVATLGYDDLAELRGQPGHEKVHYKRPDGSPYPAGECPLLRSRLEGTETHSEDEWFVRRDGSMFPIAWWSAPLDLPTGCGAVLSFTDITERRAAEEAIRARDAAEIRAAESRAAQRRIVENSIMSRRQMARDLHDGAQQCLVSLLMELRLARERLASGAGNLHSLIEDAVRNAESAIDELRELAAGIHPAILSVGGLLPALEALGARAALPVTIMGSLEARIPETIEVSAYFFVAEALTNAIKHARASQIEVSVGIEGSRLWVAIRDDGIGGVRLGGTGGGLAGLTDRVEALDGRLIVTSPQGGGTTLRAEIPLVHPPGHSK
jgi:PAS domain S-box-containing protein